VLALRFHSFVIFQTAQWEELMRGVVEVSGLEIFRSGVSRSG
jgi:hypothetical protein